MIEGQMSVFDFVDNPYESIGEKYTREGYTNVYDRHPDHPCEVDVIDHEGNRFRTRAVESFGRMAFDITHSKGYGICWWKEVPEGKPKLCGDDDPPCAWKDGSHCATCQRKPKPEKGDCATCEYSFWKHGVDGTSRGCQYHGGHDGCHYEKRKTCRSCSHMRRSVWGLMEYHGFACFGFGISKSDNMNNAACHDYETATDGEEWRTSDKAVDEWLDR